MLNYVSEEREKELQDLQNFTDNVRQQITDITSTLNWTVESIVKDNENYLICPHNSSHRFAKDCLNKHLTSCQWKAEGYNDFDVPLSEPVLSSDSSYSIKLDRYLQNNILLEAKAKDPNMKISWGERLVPRTSNRLITDFTPDERRALYEYAISNTTKADIGNDITDTHRLKSEGKEDKKLSFLELLLQERNLKRRRAKHRGVHTNKKSHTEILREVINQQMELYTDYIMDSCKSTSGEEIAEQVQSQDPWIDSNQILSNSSQSFKESSSFKEFSPFKQSSSFKECSSRHANTGPREAHIYRPSAQSRSNEYERTMSKHISRSRDREKRGRHYSPSKEPSKKHKRHDEHRKKYRSRERRSNKKDKHRSRSRDRKRDDSHLKRNGDRRKDRDYYKFSNDY